MTGNKRNLIAAIYYCDEQNSAASYVASILSYQLVHTCSMKSTADRQTGSEKKTRSSFAT